MMSCVIGPDVHAGVQSTYWDELHGDGGWSNACQGRREKYETGRYKCEHAWTYVNICKWFAYVHEKECIYMYIYMCVCEYVHIHICLHICIYVCPWQSMSMKKNVSKYICINVYTGVYT